MAEVRICSDGPSLVTGLRTDLSPSQWNSPSTLVGIHSDYLQEKKIVEEIIL